MFIMDSPFNYRRASYICAGNRVASCAWRNRHRYPRSVCTTPGSAESLCATIPVITVSDSRLLESVRHSENPALQTVSNLTIPRSRSERNLGAYVDRSSCSSAASSRESSPDFSSRKESKRSVSPGSRSIRVEFPDSRKSSSQSLNNDLDESTHQCNTPLHNLSSSLTMTSLENGKFAAELSLKHLPMDDLVLQASGHRLEVVVDKNVSSHDRTHTVAVPYHYGVVDLPIFVEASSLVFAKDSERNVLLLEGRNKGCADWDCSTPSSLIQRSHWRPNVVSMFSKLLTKLKLRKAKDRRIFVNEVKNDQDI